MIIERFAPSPSGYLHLGHAYSAIMGYENAQAQGGNWLLRIEDIDFIHCKGEFVEAIFEDLDWLGLKWSYPVLYQSKRQQAYQAILTDLMRRELIYGCCCRRGEIKAALSAPQEGDEPRLTYPGTCRGKGLSGSGLAWRLDIGKALLEVEQLSYREIGQGRDVIIALSNQDLLNHGDIVLARRDIGVSYHLAVVVDDAHQGITHITRGADLEGETAIHVLLQALLRLPTPIYRHHTLIRDDKGKRLAKRHDSLSIRSMRESGKSRGEIIRLIEANLEQFRAG